MSDELDHALPGDPRVSPDADGAQVSDSTETPGRATVYHWAGLALLVGAFVLFCQDHRGLLTILLTAQGLSIAGSCALAIVLSLRRVPIAEISLFAGAGLFGGRLGGVRWRVGWFPFGFSVRMRDDSAIRPRPERAFIALVFIAIPFGGSIAFLGLDEALHSVSTGFLQLLEGAWSPLSVGTERVGNWAQIVNGTGIPVAVGILLAKFACMDLMFLMPLRIAQLVLVPDGVRAGEVPRTIDNVAAVGFLLQMLHSILWTVAICNHFFFVR